MCNLLHLQVMGAAVQIHQDINKMATRLNRHMEGWRKYSDIWKADRLQLLDKFKAKSPITAAFEEKFSKFRKVQVIATSSSSARGIFVGKLPWCNCQPS